MKQFKFKIRGQKYEVELKDFEDNKAVIEVNGTSYEIEVEQDVIKQPKTPRIIRKPVSMADQGDKMQHSTGVSEVKAPLPGNIFEISVKVGDPVEKGKKLLVMEAMKMENDILAEVNGTIKEVKVSTGDAVLQGDILIIIE